MENKPPVMIIAAARSGTKMLRRVLAESPDFSVFAYDINYIWKYGNYHVPHDELIPENIRPEIAAFIRERVNGIKRGRSNARVLEKTVSNSLRVRFVKAIFPEAKLIHLVRDGRDVAASARRCWEASMFSGRIQTKRELLQKLAGFPWRAAWPYLLSYANGYFQRFFGRRRSVPSWGPRFKGIDEAVREKSLIEVCGMQWNRCVERATEDLSALVEEEDFVTLKYEALVANPEAKLRQLADFIEIRDTGSVRRAAAGIANTYVGSWRRMMAVDETVLAETVMRDNLLKLGYL